MLPKVVAACAWCCRSWSLLMLLLATGHDHVASSQCVDAMLSLLLLLPLLLLPLRSRAILAYPTIMTWAPALQLCLV